MSFKVGDFVKVKEGTLTESGNPMSNWAGKIVELHPELCTIELDALTLNILDDDYLLEVLEEGSDATQYIFEYGDLIPSQRRDTESSLKNAVKIIENRLDELDDAEEGENIGLVNS
jgi:hypothetical protein